MKILKLTLTLHKGNRKKKTEKNDDFYRNSHFQLTSQTDLRFSLYDGGINKLIISQSQMEDAFIPDHFVAAHEDISFKRK